MKIAIGADHRGFRHKEYIKSFFQHHADIAWFDVGAFDDERSDYPVFVRPVCEAIQHNKVDLGILLCGSGIGMSIAANRYAGIYAGIAWNEDIARLGRQDDNTNVLVIPSTIVSCQEAVAIISAWLSAEFKGGRYQDRLDMLDKK
jgi:ribose 5-phosphate isomerase B